MTQRTAWTDVADECPLRLPESVHASGERFHGCLKRYPGKVLCFHLSTLLPGDWEPTQAQERADTEGNNGYKHQ